MYEKGPCGASFYVSFSKSLNMKKILSYTFVRIVKLLNDIGIVTMTNISPSWGLLNLLGWIHLKDEITVQAYAIPLKIAIKKLLG